MISMNLNYSGACGTCGHRKRKHQSNNHNVWIASTCHVSVYSNGIYFRCGCEKHTIDNLKYLELKYAQTIK